MGYGSGILSQNVYGIDKAHGHYNNRVPGDVCDESSAWVDFNTLGHNSAKYDFFYELSIPYSELGITKADVEANGVGVMVVATMGKSAMDCLPGDVCMTDQADLDDSAGSQENNSFEKSDEDFITSPFARIGKIGEGGTVTPPVVQPTTVAPTTVAPATQAPTTVAPATTEPAEVTTVAPTTDAIVIPPVVTTAPAIVAPTTTDAIEIPTLDFGDDTTPTETTKATEVPTTATNPVVVPTAGILGDADGNGLVNIKDATLIQKHLAKITTLSEDAQFLSDVDGNEELNIRDVTAIQKWLAKLDVDFAIGEPVEGEEIVIPVPTTVAPATTEAPTTTEAPVVVEPTTEAPVTVAPATTEAPTTQPATEAPTTIVTEPVYTEPVYTNPVTPDDPYIPDNGTVTIYFENTYGWSAVYWHAWNDAGGTSTPWPGDMMTNVSGNIYSAQVSTEFTGIIFDDGSGSDSAKTEDTTIAGDGMMFSNGSWTTYDPNYNGGGGNDDPYYPPSGDGRTVYFSNVNHWDAVYAYVWNDGGGKNAEWPGEMMTLVEEDNGYGEQVYSFTVSAEYNYIIFSNGNGTQCADINLNNEVNNGFYLTGDVVNDKGHYGYESYERY